MKRNIFARPLRRAAGRALLAMEETMRTETDEIRDNLKYLTLLSRDYPSQAAAASEIISTQALLKLPKGTEHFMSDLHGENEAFVHILNSASGVIREKVDQVLGEAVPEHTRAELATLIYYPNEKLPQLKARCADEEVLDHPFIRMFSVRIASVSDPRCRIFALPTKSAT